MGVERRSLRWAVWRGVLAGVLYGSFQGLTEGSVLTGFMSGTFFALAMTTAYYLARRSGEHLVGLSYRQKRAVLRAVRRGEPVNDPALAQPTIRHAQRVEAQEGSQRSAVVLAQGLLVASVLGLGLALVLGSAAGAGAAGFSLVVWTVILLLGPPLDARKAANARAAEDAARAAEVAARNG